MGKFLHIKYGIIAGGAFLLGLGVSIAGASIPSSNTGQITGCYRKTGNASQTKGSLRLIDVDANEMCSNQETSVSWGRSSDGIGSLMADRLKNAELSDARFLYQNLRGVDFSHSSMSGTIFTGSDVSNANFSYVNQLDAVFDYATADGADFSDISYVYIRVNHGSFNDTNFSNTKIHEISGTRSIFDGSNFSNAEIEGSISEGSYRFINANGLRTVTYSQPQVSNNDFTGSDFTSARIITFSGTIFSNNFTNVNFSNSIFESSNQENDMSFRDNDFTNTNFTNSKFKNIDFRDQDLTQAIFSGVTWENVQCPDHTNSDNNDNTCLGHLQP